MDVVVTGKGSLSGLAVRDHVKEYINNSVMMDGHKMVLKAKTFNDKKNTMSVAWVMANLHGFPEHGSHGSLPLISTTHSLSFKTIMHTHF